jgi:acyl-CoA thioesterase-1
MHVAQTDHAAAFDGGHGMRLKLADDSGALAAGAMRQGYGDCAGRVNTPRPDARRPDGGCRSGRAAPSAPHAAAMYAGASHEDAPLGRRGPTSNGASFGRVLRSVWLFAVLLCASVTVAHAEPLRIAMLGDSLTAGFGLPPEQALPAKLEAALKAAGRDVTVANNGVSGDTSAGGLARLDWTLGDKPKLVIVALGANDALRGLDPEETEKNLDAIIARTRAAGAAVLLCGMKAPRNYGPDYVAKFDGLYERLAQKYDVPLMPFLLEGVAMVPELNQTDGMHPNSKGVDEVVSHLAPAVMKALDGMKKPAG